MAPDDTPSLPRPFFDSVPALSIDLSANCSLIVVLHAGSAHNNGGFAVPQFLGGDGSANRGGARHWRRKVSAGQGKGIQAGLTAGMDSNLLYATLPNLAAVNGMPLRLHVA